MRKERIPGLAGAVRLASWSWPTMVLFLMKSGTAAVHAEQTSYIYTRTRVERLGSNRLRINVRIIAATNRNLEK